MHLTTLKQSSDPQQEYSIVSNVMSIHFNFSMPPRVPKQLPKLTSPTTRMAQCYLIHRAVTTHLTAEFIRECNNCRWDSKDGGDLSSSQKAATASDTHDNYNYHRTYQPTINAFVIALNKTTQILGLPPLKSFGSCRLASPSPIVSPWQESILEDFMCTFAVGAGFTADFRFANLITFVRTLSIMVCGVVVGRNIA
ncbi:hypothetical protein CEXT_39671 [Caerostris extrusa]|uniref:Uncharacterized protein n=1 Tax=Caerostris extrusa TaxID=172846 RepID=A0AAV4PV29_CAEEX|nr:hypothetical protein CEXT_39671 [Caerostris extrusa]